MTDDEHIELASAYLDGEVTAAERARVEDDPALAAEVDRLRAVRAVVAHVPEPRVNVREQHLAAAFEAWERVPAERDPTPRGTRTRRDRRRPAAVNRWMLAAAAALVVVLAGGLTLRSLTDRGTDDTTAEVADDAAEAAEIAAEVPVTAAADDAEQASTAEESMELSEAVEMAEEADAAPATPDPDTADPDTDPATDEAAAAPPPDDDLVVLATPVDLASFAADGLAADDDVAAANADAIDGEEDSGGQLPDNARTIPPADEESLGPAELPECAGADLNVGPAIYDDIEVVVSIDAARRWALAYAIEDCQLVARARLDTAE